MKILQVVSMGHVAGGAERSVVILKSELTGRGHTVQIIATEAPDQDSFADYTFPSIALGSWWRRAVNYVYYATSAQAPSAIADFSPDVVHFHTLTGTSPSALFATSGTPSLLTIHGPEAFTTDLLPWFLDPSDYKTRPFDLTDLTLVGKTRYWFYRLVQRPLYRRGFKRLRLVVAPSRYIMRATAKDFRPVPMRQIYNGIERLAPSPMPTTSRLLFVGRLERVKGVHVLLEAVAGLAKRLPDVRLRIVGDGPARADLEALTARLGVADHVEFAGLIPAGQIAAEHGASTTLVIPSVWPENLPTVAIEAMSVGRPIVGTDTGGLPELIDDGRTGFIVAPGDSVALENALEKLLTDRQLCEAMGRAAHEKSAAFAIDAFTDQVLSAYSMCAGS